MTRNEYVLAVMAAAGAPLTPVQVQKLFFILDMKAGTDVGGPHFKFEPYNYGPFDAAVYHELDALSQRGLVAIAASSTGTRCYAVTGGMMPGLSLLAKFPVSTQSYIRKVAEYVRSMSFAQLVSAVYQQWPEMKAKSIFRG